MEKLAAPIVKTDTTAMQFCGEHVIADVHGIAFKLLNDADYLCSLLEEAVTYAGATTCGRLVKKFEPQGVTVLVLLEESHASLHSYPEAGSMFLDIFTCGTRCKPSRAFDHIVSVLKAVHYDVKVVNRGALVAAKAAEAISESGA